MLKFAPQTTVILKSETKETTVAFLHHLKRPKSCRGYDLTTSFATLYCFLLATLGFSKSGKKKATAVKRIREPT